MQIRRTFGNLSRSLDCSRDPSRARQEFLHDSNINNVVKRFIKTGVLAQPNLGRSSVDGLELPPDFQTAYEFSVDAQRYKESHQNVESTDEASNKEKIVSEKSSEQKNEEEGKG